MIHITRQTQAGTIVGLLEDQCEIYRGIPYAYPPIQQRRFKHAELLTQWHDVLYALDFKSIPPQPYNKLEAFFSTHPEQSKVPSLSSQSEDCLYLNLWKPRHAHQSSKLPVMIWLYGGGYINGHGSAELYDPQTFAQQENVIVVTFNYRLGPLGYLNWKTLDPDLDGNCGLSDQYAVLQWVQQFIEAFGGDPNNVTLCGQSAGAMSIQALMHVTKAQPLFHKAVMMSGTLSLDSVEDSCIKAQHFAQIMHKRYQTNHPSALSTAQIMACMEEDLTARGPSKGLELVYQPFFDSATMTQNIPNQWPVLAGYTKCEGDCYIRNESRKLKPEQFLKAMRTNHVVVDTNRFSIETGKGQAQAVTHYIFKQPLLKWLKHYNNPNQWLYRFDWLDASYNQFKSPYHILDVIFWLGQAPILKAHHVPLTDDLKQTMHAMMTALGRFVREGHPAFEPYTQSHTPYLFK